MTPHILVVEDDSDIQEYVRNLLTENGYTVTTTSTGTSALALINKTEPDLVVLDLKLPDISGEDVCLEIRKKYPNVRIIMLTAKDSLTDKVKGLEAGADDYITKPFAAEEFLARIKTRIKHQTNKQTKLKIADLELDPKKVLVTRSGKPVTLTPTEFNLLQYLMKNKGIVLTRDVILNRIWLYSPDVESRVVDVYIGYLRKKVDNGYKRKLIQCIRGFGYTIKD